MKFGLSPQYFDYILTEVVKPLETYGAEVWCYGSRARGDHQKFSDLDLMVESNTDLSKVICELQEKLTNSNFPYKIDLVQINEFADSYKDGYLVDRKRFA